MKPTNTIQNHEPKLRVPQRHNFDSTPQRVEVDFSRSLGWQVEIGRTPAKAFPAQQSMRDNRPVTGYKRPHGRSRFTHVFVPVELVIEAEKQRAQCRQVSCRAAP